MQSNTLCYHCKTSFVNLQDTTVALDFQVTTLQENGNHTDVRVEALEGTAADHETKISAAETDVTSRFIAWFIV